MLLKEQGQPIQSSASYPSQQFSIDMTAKAFKVLSSGLYKNKNAYVRELATNALDSHVSAGCPEKPFVVHIPNYQEPYFSIRDFGTGLSDEEIHSLYTHYFKSNKGESNDFVGALGLGSKSPFAATDNFLVESFYNGKKYIYNILIDNGFPTVKSIGMVDTDEPNGLFIQIPVKSSDFSSVKEAAQDYYRFFKVKPQIQGAILEWKEKAPIVEGDGWKLYGPDFSSYAIMGSIGYPIEWYSLSATNSLHDTIQSGLEIDFKIGDLDITASREALSYDDDTKKKVIERLTQIQAELKDKFTDHIANAASYYEACCRWFELPDTLQKCTGDDYPEWKGRPVHRNQTWANTDSSFVKTSVRRLTRGKRDGVSAKHESDFGSSSAHVFILNDLDGGKGAVGRCRWHFLEEELKNLYLIDAGSKEGFQDFLDKTGLLGYKIGLASELPKPVRSPSDHKAGNGYVLNSNNRHDAMQNWTRESIYAADFSYYVPILRGWAGQTHPRTLIEYIDLLAAAGVAIAPEQIAGVNGSREKVFKKYGCINFVDFAKEQIRKYVSNNPTLSVWIDAQKEIKEFEDAIGYFYLDEFKDKLNKTTYECVEISGIFEDLKALSALRNETAEKFESYITPTGIRRYDLLGRFERFKATYPMLALTDFEIPRDSIQLIVDYMAQMDSLAAQKEEVATCL